MVLCFSIHHRYYYCYRYRYRYRYQRRLISLHLYSISYLFYNFRYYNRLVGGVSQTFLAFVLPPLMWSKQRYTHHTRDGSSSSSSSSSNAGDIWYCFLKLPRKEKMFVVGGFGLILWTLHSTWIGIQSGNE